VLCWNIEQIMRFNNSAEKYEIMFYPHRLLPATSKSVLERNHFAYVTVDDSPIMTDISSDYVLAPFNRCTEVELDLVQRITLKSKRLRPCDAGQPFLECVGRCRVAEATTKCNCSPVSWEVYIPDSIDLNVTPSCFSLFPPHEYDACRELFKEQKVCRKACLPACEDDIFNVIAVECQSTAAVTSGATTVAYRLRRFFYSHMQEEFMFDIAMLASSLGGIIGLWLGVSFIGLVEAVVYMPKMFILQAMDREKNAVGQNTVTT